MTAHDHCYSTHDFADMTAAGITVRTIKLGADNTYWSEGQQYYWGPPIPLGRTVSDMEMDFLGPIQQEIKRLSDDPSLLVVKQTADIHTAKQTGRLGIILSFEGGSLLKPPDLACQQENCDPKKCIVNLTRLHALGLRDFQPYWGADNWLKAQHDISDPNWEHAGLNCYGRVLLEKSADLGIVTDLSHMGRVTFLEVINKIGPKQPFILSHAGVAAVSLCERDKSECGTYKEWAKTLEKSTVPLVDPPGGSMMLDENALKIVKEHHGVIALHFLADYVSYNRRAQGQDVTLRDLVNEIDYIRSKCGIDCVALGPDYLPASDPRPWVRGARDMTELRSVAIEMVVHTPRYSDPEIKQVLGRNLLRLYGCVWSPADCGTKVPQGRSAPDINVRH